MGVKKEAKAAASGQVTRRADDPFGQGFGNVKTGYVSSQKLSFLQRAVSLERYDAQSEPKSCSPAPSNSSERKGLRVTWAESPQSSRPSSNLGWTEKVAEMESETMRAQTPPLAGEWAVSKGTNVESKSFKQSNMAVASNMTAVNNSKNEMNMSRSIPVPRKTFFSLFRLCSHFRYCGSIGLICKLKKK